MSAQTKALNELAAITDAAYQSDLAKLQAITAEETRLREDLATLAAAERRNAASDPTSVLAMRQIGGDILWKAWVGRKREALNLALATVMARKLTAAQALRRSFGKSSVARSLQDDHNQTLRAEQTLKALADEQAQLVLRARRQSVSGST